REGGPFAVLDWIVWLGCACVASSLLPGEYTHTAGRSQASPCRLLGPPSTSGDGGGGVAGDRQHADREGRDDAVGELLDRRGEAAGRGGGGGGARGVGGGRGGGAWRCTLFGGAARL